MSASSVIKDMQGYIGKEIFVSDWTQVTQEQINLFADSTKDHQWIHVDLDKAAKGPFGQTIAHGFLTLSHLPFFSYQVPLKFEGAKMSINYGLDKVRFLNPVMSGAKIRDRIVLIALECQKKTQKLNGLKCNEWPVGLSDDPALSLQILQMGDGLTGGKPLLGNRKVFPGFAIDVPGHPGGNLIGVHRPAAQDFQHFIRPLTVMTFEFINPPLHVREKIPVTRQDEFHIQLANPVKTDQIIGQRVDRIRPGFNMRRDVKENMVS